MILSFLAELQLNAVKINYNIKYLQGNQWARGELSQVFNILKPQHSSADQRAPSWTASNLAYRNVRQISGITCNNSKVKESNIQFYKRKSSKKAFALEKNILISQWKRSANQSSRYYYPNLFSGLF